MEEKLKYSTENFFFSNSLFNSAIASSVFTYKLLGIEDASYSLKYVDSWISVIIRFIFQDNLQNFDIQFVLNNA